MDALIGLGNLRAISVGLSMKLMFKPDENTSSEEQECHQELSEPYCAVLTLYSKRNLLFCFLSSIKRRQ